jgi:hypothetical protein
MIKGRIATHPSCQLLPRNQTERNGSDRRSEHVTGDRDQAVGSHDRPQVRQQRNNARTDRKHGERRDYDTAFCACRVDRRAHWRAQDQTEQAAGAGHKANSVLAPMLLRHQVDVEIRPERSVNVGKQEVERVE